MSNTVTLSGFEVGGLNFPIWYRTHPVGSVHVTLRYASSPYITVYCRTPRRRAAVIIPEGTETLSVEEVARYSKRRVYRLTGVEVDETVRQLSSAVRVEEAEKIMASYIDYVAQNFLAA